MKATYLSLTLALLTLAFMTSCGPDALSPKVEVTDLTFKKTTATLQPGETLQLTATVTPQDAKVTFTSDNAGVATVSETGLVKAVAPGTATITAQAGDKKATCVITVAEVKNVTIFNKLDGRKYPSGSTIDYVATISEEDARSYDPELFFSVLQTMQYDGRMTFDTPINGGVCLGEQCKQAKNLTLFTAKVTLTADDEAIEFGKEKGEMTPLNTHIKLNTKAGETYKNRMTIEFAPLTGEGETLKWTINLAITVK